MLKYFFSSIFITVWCQCSDNVVTKSNFNLLRSPWICENPDMIRSPTVQCPRQFGYSGGRDKRTRFCSAVWKGKQSVESATKRNNIKQNHRTLHNPDLVWFAVRKSKPFINKKGKRTYRPAVTSTWKFPTSSNGEYEIRFVAVLPSSPLICSWVNGHAKYQ